MRVISLWEYILRGGVEDSKDGRGGGFRKAKGAGGGGGQGLERCGVVGGVEGVMVRLGNGCWEV